MRAQHRRQAQQAHRHADALASLPGSGFEAGEHASVLGGGLGGHRLVGPGERVPAPAVQLDPAAHHDALQRAALGGSADEGCGGGIGEGTGEAGAGPGVGLPHRQVHEYMGVERGDHIDDAVAVGWFDAVELGASQSPSRRVNVDAHQRADPRFGFEHRCDQRAQLASHPAHE